VKKIKTDITIVGAGLCGALLATRLAERGHNIVMLEKRRDLRWADISAGRSINLALSDRGLRALSAVGLDDEARLISIPMHGRMIHGVDGSLRHSPYSGRKEDYINSISRSSLNALLLDQADRYDTVEIYFETQTTTIDIENRVVRAESSQGEQIEISSDCIIGADGAGSQTRQALEALLGDEFSSSSEFLSSGYKELHIPPTSDGGFRIEKHALHIWPRGSFMIIALPNLDGSFTVTLFWPYEGEHGFDKIKNEEAVLSVFREHFPDLPEHLPDLTTDYFNNPTGKLGTLKCEPWYFQDRVCLIGDACHPIVPFYGQGMNAAFEDTVVFMEAYDNSPSDWGRVFENFSKIRKIDTDAIADLALDNFYEMQDHVDDPAFIMKRSVEMRLEQELENYYSKYGLVTFREDLPYSVAMKQGRRQDELLLELCRSGRHKEMSLTGIQSWISERLV